MPNWCFNTLYIFGDEVQDFKKAVKGYPAQYKQSEIEAKYLADTNHSDVPKESDFTFHALVPVPQDILDQGYNEAGYNWQINNWGTKWDIGNDFNLIELSEKELAYQFDTAWSPPTSWVYQASLQLPQFIFNLSFHEESRAFAGKVIFQNGNVLYEKACENYREVAEFVKEEFGIAYEEEEDE